MTEQEIQEFLNSYNYDVRETGNARWIDQKCTPDVLWSISDFICAYVDEVNEEFTVTDIWHSDYAKESVDETYSKPGTKSQSAENEYDKFFSQPLNLLEYAGVLRDISSSNRHKYVVNNREVLDYIARNDINAYRFLVMYISNVLEDSGLMNVFESFFRQQNKTSFRILKDTFISFYKRWTPVQKDYEPKRIFTKVINPLAYSRRCLGTIRGNLSKNIIRYSDLMYNRDNFRDIYSEKPKEITRQEWEIQCNFRPNLGYWNQLMNSAKRKLRSFNNDFRGNMSELSRYMNNHNDSEPATQIHHIFPKSDFPSIMYYLENLICLTPNEHYGFAHPNNTTQYVDPAAQKELLIAKTYSIKENLSSVDEEHIYEFDNFLNVMSVGWEDDNVLEISNENYNEILQLINSHYID